MTLRSTIETKLRQALAPSFLEVLDESSMHSVPAGSESHFRLRVVADAFAGRGLLERHRAVNALLAEELANGVHALAVEALTPEEWAARGGTGQESPPCLGGDGTAPAR